MKFYYITFGSSHKHYWMEINNPLTLAIKVKAHNEEEARKWAFDTIGDRWSTIREECIDSVGLTMSDKLVEHNLALPKVNNREEYLQYFEKTINPAVLPTVDNEWSLLSDLLPPYKNICFVKTNLIGEE